MDEREPEDLQDDIVERAAEDFRKRIEAGGNPGSLTKWAERYGVTRFRLARRLKGIGPRRDRIPVNKKLSEAQEAALIRYIRDMDDIGTSVRIDQVANVANHILAADWPEDAEEPPPTVHKAWPKRFWDRYPELYKMKQKPLALERKVAQEPDQIMNWFSRFQQLRDELGVQNEDIWNMDETGFRIGIERSQWIITTIQSRRAYLATDENRELVTSIEAISAGGHVLPPMLILQGKVHMEKWYEDLQEDIKIGISESGYNNDENALAYIYHFDQYSRKTQKGVWRILLSDNLKSHITRPILEFCERQKIKLFMLPAHTSHFLQPLDVVVFQPLKHFHAKAVDDATRKGCSTFDKVEFLHAIKGIRKNTFKRDIILSAFRLTGLVPFNPSIVLQKIEEFRPPAAFQPQSGRFQTPSEDEDDDPKTPITPRGLERLSLRLKAAEEGSPSRRKAIQEKFVKGALIQSKAGAALKTTLKENTAYSEARRLRHQRSKNWLQTGGTLSVAEARELKLQRETEGGRGRDRAARRENQLQRALYDEQQKFKRLVESLPEELRPSESSESESDEM